MSKHWPPEILIPSSKKLVPAILKLHEPMHGRANHEAYSLNLIFGVGQSDCECPERVWSPHNALGNSTKTQGPGSRQDVLDDHFNFWNWQKYINMGTTLHRKYRAAVADRNIQYEIHCGIPVEREAQQSWEAMCTEWENDGFPKTAENPYDTGDVYITESQVKKELAEEEKKRIEEEGSLETESCHPTSAASFISLGLDLEESQRRIRRLAQDPNSSNTDRKGGNLLEQRNSLRIRIRAWKKLHSTYMPGLERYQSLLPQEIRDRDVLDKSEEIPLWLPSDIPLSERDRVCVKEVAPIEDRLRTAQCHDALENLRNILSLKSRMVAFKNKNIRGQREGTRSRAGIDRVHDRARAAASKYRSARSAKLNLIGPGAWEDELRTLEDKDIRSYQDPDRLRPRLGRRGVLEDDQVRDTFQANISDGNNNDDINGDSDFEMDIGHTDAQENVNQFTLFNDIRSRRDGTGESRKTISWIWQSPKPTDDDALDTILRAEWTRSRARVARTKEEVMLLKEEMRRTLTYMRWKAGIWRERAKLPEVGNTEGEQTAELLDGKNAFALKQAGIQLSLASQFQNLWSNALQDMQSSEKDETFKKGEDDGDDDDDDDDDDKNSDYEGGDTDDLDDGLED